MIACGLPLCRGHLEMRATVPLPYPRVTHLSDVLLLHRAHCRADGHIAHFLQISVWDRSNNKLLSFADLIESDGRAVHARSVFSNVRKGVDGRSIGHTLLRVEAQAVGHA